MTTQRQLIEYFDLQPNLDLTQYVGTETLKSSLPANPSGLPVARQRFDGPDQYWVTDMQESTGDHKLSGC